MEGELGRGPLPVLTGPQVRLMRDSGRLRAQTLPLTSPRVVKAGPGWWREDVPVTVTAK